MKKALLLVLITAIATAAVAVRAQGTAFTYQGRLQNNGTPANGTYDLMFTLYSTNVDGVVVAGPVTNSDVTVSNGLFTVTIDFGAGVFTGNNFWLDVSVSPAGSNAFTDLSPRQPILPTPYAMMADAASNLLGRLPGSQLTGPIDASELNGSVPSASLTSIPAGNLTGTVPLAQLPSAVVTDTESGVTLSGTFSGNGSGLTALNPANLSAGTAGINISGNAATATSATTAESATTAATATTANNFSGSLSGDVTGTENATVVSTVGGVTAANVASGANAANAAASANTAGTIVQRDGSGNFSAGTITANLAGNATTATTATTALNFTGNIADSQLSANVAMLNGTNAFTGTNSFAGVTSATNANNTFAGTFIGNGAGLTALNPANLTSGTASINISGNAATATSATTATTAGSATTAATATTANNFSGSLSGDVTGTENATVVSTVGGVTAASVASGANAANAAASANTAGAIVQRDGSGNFSAGTITANLAGNATTATTATTALNFTGNIVDSQLSANVARLNGTNAFTGTNSFAGVTSATNANNTFAGTFIGNGAGLTALNPANLTSGTASINISGNAATATSATTAATATLASSLASGATITGAFVTNSTFAGNGGGLTGLNASQLVGSVPSASLTSVPAGNLTGTVPLAQLPSAVVTNTETGVTLSGSFSGTFTGVTVTNLSAGSISTNGSTSGQVLTSSGGVTTWANANPWLGGIPTLVTNNSTLATNAIVVGRDRGFFLGFITSVATQETGSNYFTIRLSQALSTNAVMATFSAGGLGAWSNSFSAFRSNQGFQLFTTSNSVIVQSVGVPSTVSSYGMFVHVDQY